MTIIQFSGKEALLVPQKNPSVTGQTHFPGSEPGRSGHREGCPECGRAFKRSRRWQKFCSTACRKASWTKKQGQTAVLADHEDRIRTIEQKLGIRKV